MVSETGFSAVPRAEYSRRLGELSLRRSELQQRERLTGYLQLALAAFSVTWLLFRLSHFSKTDLLLLIPVLAFVVRAVLHGRLLRAVTDCSRGIRFYEQGLARHQRELGGKRNQRRTLP